MADTFISLRNYYPHTITVDDAGGEVARVPVCIRRFNVEQMKQFTLEMRRVQTRRSEQHYIYRKPEGEEQEKEPLTIHGSTVQVHRINDGEIRRRRLEEMTPETRATFDALVDQEELAIADFYIRTITEHVWVGAGVRLEYEYEHENEDGTRTQVRTILRTGADLMKAFGGNLPVLESLVRAVNEENTMSAEAKKKSRLLSDSALFLPPPTKTANGDAPAAIVDPAVLRGSASSEPATASQALTPSGLTATRSSTRARSSRSRQKSTSSSNGSS